MPGLDLLFGAKTSALMDIWTIEHVLSGMSVGHAVRRFNQVRYQRLPGFEAARITTVHFDLVALLLVAFAWEAVEHYLETGLAGASVAHWFRGVEYWGNRLLFDPLAMLAGYALVRWRACWVTPARLASIVWLGLHVGVFPDSMYLQDWLERHGVWEASHAMAMFTPSSRFCAG